MKTTAIMSASAINLYLSRSWPRTRYLAWCLHVSMLVILAAGGCVPPPTVRPLTDDLAEPSGRANRIVLFRMTAQIGSEAVSPPPYRLELANLESGEFEPVHVFSASAEARARGWAYFLAEPREYRLEVVFLFFGYPSARFRLSVAQEEPVTYIGSLSINCRRESALLFTLITDCSDITLSNEARSAQKTAPTSLLISARLLRRVHEP